MSYRRISNYISIGFLGGLGLFNSSKLELRQLTDTNKELIFQNGQIISAAIVIICVAGLLAEIFILKNGNLRRVKNNKVIKRKSNDGHFFDPVPSITTIPEKKFTFGGIPATDEMRKKVKKNNSEINIIKGQIRKIKVTQQRQRK